MADEPKYEMIGDPEWDEDLLCQICALPLVSPTTHNTCHNSFCLKCVKAMEFVCPLCQPGPEESSFSPIKEKFVLNILGKAKVRCCWCSKVCPVSEFENHKKTCDRVVECRGKALGCSHTDRKRKISSHEATCKRAELSPVLVPFTNRISALEKENDSLKSQLEEKTKSLETKFARKTKSLETKFKGKTRSLEAENKSLRCHLKSNPLGSGVHFVKLPIVPDDSAVELFCGFYKLNAQFSVAEGHVGFFVGFEEGPFDSMFEKFPFKGRLVLSLLSPNMEPFEEAVVDTRWNEGFEKFASEFPSGMVRGSSSFATMEEVEKNADGDKLWFSVKVERY